MKIKRVRESFCYWDDKGNPHDFTAGTIVDIERTSGYKGREHLFEDVEVYVDRVEEQKSNAASAGKARTPKTADKPPVEDASAVPGEKRDLTTPKTREWKNPAK